MMTISDIKKYAAIAALVLGSSGLNIKQYFVHEDLKEQQALSAQQFVSVVNAYNKLCYTSQNSLSGKP